MYNGPKKLEMQNDKICKKTLDNLNLTTLEATNYKLLLKSITVHIFAAHFGQSGFLSAKKNLMQCTSVEVGAVFFLVFRGDRIWSGLTDYWTLGEKIGN